MCSEACIEFGRTNLKEEDIKEKSVIEVGAFDVNGSLRPVVEAFRPISYIGVDCQVGSGVDLICDAHDVLDRFGYETFDLLICTELLEHIRDWRKVISNFKHILKPNGVLLITTRSKGFPIHGHPFDLWRYEISDMRSIFSDFIIEVIEKDSLSPGVFIKARKPSTFIENDMSNYQLYSIIKGERTKTIIEVGTYWFKVQWKILTVLSLIRLFFSKILPTSIKRILKERMLGE